MALMPELSLAARPLQMETPDLTKTLLTAQQLRNLMQQEDMQRLQMQDLAYKQQQQRSLDAYLQSLGGTPVSAAPGGRRLSPEFGQFATQGTVSGGIPPLAPGEAPAIAAPGAMATQALQPAGLPQGPQAAAASPSMPQVDTMGLIRAGGSQAFPLIDAMQKARQGDLTAQKTLLETAAKSFDVLRETAGTVQDQASLEALRSRLTEMGGGHAAQFLPKVYTPDGMTQFQQQIMTFKDQVEAHGKQLGQLQTAQQIALKAQEVPDYGFGQLNPYIHARYGTQLSQSGARPTQDMVQVAVGDQEAHQRRIAAATGEEAAKITATQKPLEEATAKQVSELSATLEMAQDARAYFDPKYTGPITGRLGWLRQMTGTSTTQENLFRRVVADMKDTLLRARSGAQINEQEYKRLSDLVPDPTQQPQVFLDNLGGFERSVQQMRDAKLRTATTGRAQYRQETTGGGPNVVTKSMVEELVQRYGGTVEEMRQRLKAAGKQVE